MKNAKKIIILMIILTIIIIGVIAIIISINTNKDSNNIVNTSNSKQQNISSEYKISVEAKEVTNSAMYFTIKSCINTYTKYISEKNAQAICDVLSINYIKEKDITVNNVLEKIEAIEGKNIDFAINKMMVENDGQDIQTYYVKGIMRNEDNIKKDSDITINVDIQNKVFTIEPEVAKGVFN